VNLYDAALAFVLVGMLTGTDNGPDLQLGEAVKPVMAGEDARVHLVAPDTVAASVTIPPVDGSEDGEAAKPVTVGAGVAANAGGAVEMPIPIETTVPTLTSAETSALRRNGITFVCM
jgi:hypothetical protein